MSFAPYKRRCPKCNSIGEQRAVDVFVCPTCPEVEAERAVGIAHRPTNRMMRRRARVKGLFHRCKARP